MSTTKVDLLVQVESVGVGDETKPANAVKGVNIYSSGVDFPVGGTEHVDGSSPVAVDKTSHTRIDGEPKTVGAITEALKLTEAAIDEDARKLRNDKWKHSANSGINTDPKTNPRIRTSEQKNDPEITEMDWLYNDPNKPAQ